MKGYSTGVVNAHKHSYTSHDFGPLPLSGIWVTDLKVFVQTWIQKAYHSWKEREKTIMHVHVMNKQMNSLLLILFANIWIKSSIFGAAVLNLYP